MHIVIALMLAVMTTSAASAQTSSPDYFQDPRTGCRIFFPNREPQKTIGWSGGCQNSLAHGRGVAQFYENGKPYIKCECEYREGKANGHGVQTAPRGRFEGEFRNDSFYAGVFTSTEGTRIEGQWRDGQPFGVMKFTFTDGMHWEAPVRDGRMNGPLTLLNTKTGIRWEGNVRNGEPIGSGKCFRPRDSRPVATSSVSCFVE